MSRPTGSSVGSAASASSTANASTFKILLTTDNHLGFAERDAKRGDDSYTTFEEILRAARVEHEVDFILLGGDLFHENKPSQGCQARASALFRKYLWGSRPIDFTLLSDPARNFPTHAIPLANYQDPNLNIAVPAFAIHGNHDDPVGGTSMLDVMATNGHLNYFGLVSSLEDIALEPILLHKGGTYLALYGLGNIRDDRLHRCFQLNKVRFVRPAPLPGDARWFTILVLHQNRGVRESRSKTGVMESMLAGHGLDLVIWGNEHEQLMVPQPSHGFDVVQPGSSILTSISPLECNPKQYGVLEVRGTSYRLTPFPLRSVRPVVRRTVVLRRDNPRGRSLEAVEEFLRSVMDEMIEEAEEQVQRVPDDVLRFHQNVRFPLMRLSVDFTDAESAPFPQPNLNRFGQQYMDVVANPGDLLRPIRPTDKRSTAAMAAALRRGTLGADGGPASGSMLSFPVMPPQLRTLDIAAKVAEVFRSRVKLPCALVSEMELSAAVHAFAEKHERDALTEKLNEQLHTTQKMVWRRLDNGSSENALKADVMLAEVHQCKLERDRRFFKELDVLSDLTNSTAGVVHEDEEHELAESAAAKKKAAQKVHATPTGPAAAAAASPAEEGTDEDADDEEARGRERFKRLSEMFDGVTHAGSDDDDDNNNNGGGGARGLSRAQKDQVTGGGLRQLTGARGGVRSGEGSSALADSDTVFNADELLARAAGGFGADEVPPFLRDFLQSHLEEDGQQEPASARAVAVGQSARDTGRCESDRAGRNADDGDELEELPADGLNRVTLDDFVSRQMTTGDDDGAPAVAAHVKRPRTAAADALTGAVVIDADDNTSDCGDDGDGHVGVAARAPRRRTATASSASNTRATRPRARGGRAGAGAAADAAGARAPPALQLVPNTSSRGATSASTSAQPAVSRAAASPRASPSDAGVRSLLEKWGAQGA